MINYNNEDYQVSDNALYRTSFIHSIDTASFSFVGKFQIQIQRV